MGDIGEYLRADAAFVSANLGWRKALRFALLWLAGMFVPLGVRAWAQIPEWLAIAWMIIWASPGYVFALYALRKHQRAQTASERQPDRK